MESQTDPPFGMTWKTKGQMAWERAWLKEGSHPAMCYSVLQETVTICHKQSATFEIYQFLGIFFFLHNSKRWRTIFSYWADHWHFHWRSKGWLFSPVFRSSKYLWLIRKPHAYQMFTHTLCARQAEEVLGVKELFLSASTHWDFR